MEETFEYIFPAIRGVQANHEFYVSQCPLPLIPKIFLFDEDELLPEFRAQRTLNRARVPEMSNYILDNRDDWIFSALTASIDGETRFVPLGGTGPEARIGALHVPMSARFIINDGQHRRAAIEQALREEPGLADESIGVVFFIDLGLKRSQQMFADLNRYAVKPSKSLGVLYDHRDPLAEITRLAVFKSPFFRDVVEVERTTLAPRSRRLFTLSSVYTGTKALLGKLPTNDDDIEIPLVADEVRLFWEESARQFREWQMVKDRRLTAAEVRSDFIHTHAIVLHSLGNAGNALLREHPDDWKDRLEPIADIDWSRSNTDLWEGRATIGGRVAKSRQNVVLTTNVIKMQLGLELTPEEQRAEDLIASEGRP